MDEKAMGFESDQQANRLIVRCMRYTIPFVVLVWILNLAGVFILDKWQMTIAMVVCSTILIIPSIVVNMLGVTSGWVKYFCMVVAVLFVNGMYAVLEYHITSLLFIPCVLSMFYMKKPFIITTAILNLIAMFWSHWLSPTFTIVPDIVFEDRYRSMVYGFLPHVITLAMTVVICLVANNRSARMLRKVFEYSDEISRSAKALDSVAVQTQKFFANRNIAKLSRAVISAVSEVLTTQQHRAVIPMGFVCFRADEDEINLSYYYIDQGGTRFDAPMDGNRLTISHSGKTFTAKIHDDMPTGVLDVRTDGVTMLFYEKRELIGMCHVSARIDTNVQDITHILDLLYVNIKLAIINTRLNDSIFQNQMKIIFAFAEISESKSEQTGKHIKRVAEYMRILGEYFGLDEEECETLSIASMMHDIGKLMVPPEILEKPGRLTDQEFDIVKEHIQHGYKLLEHSSGRVMSLSRTISHQHHERWDGTGYMGMRGEDIDFYSRLMAVADVFDALVSKRSYKQKWTLEDAYKEIVSQKGRHFDPQVVDGFVECFDRFADVVNRLPDDKRDDDVAY